MPSNNQDSAKPTQEQQDEIMKQITLNQEFENQLKQEINNTSPFVSELLDLRVVKAEYSENKFENCFDALYTRYKNVRRLRRDGNCFYRAFLF